jgi:DNA-binding MarR family transcriptional regulator
LSSGKPYTDKQFADTVSELWRTFMPSPDPSEQHPPEDRPFTPEAALQGLVVVSILRMTNEIKVRMENFVRPFDLTTSRMGVLLTLFFNHDKLSPSDLGERLFVTRGNMTGLIQGLVRDGLVRRAPRSGDRRAHDLELTEAGHALVGEYLPHHRRALALLTAGLAPEERLQLAALLQKLRAGMQTPEPPTR